MEQNKYNSFFLFDRWNKYNSFLIKEKSNTCKDIFTNIDNTRGLANTTPGYVENSVKNIWMAIMHTNPEK